MIATIPGYYVVVRTEGTLKTVRVLWYRDQRGAERVAFELNRSNQDHTWNRATAVVEPNTGQKFPGIAIGQ